jgi:tRNA(fMet)-specific endonuclease VapC
MNYVLDTSMISAYMKNNERVKKKLQEIALCAKEVFISGIAYYEIKRGLLAVNATRQLKIFDKICKAFGILLLDDLEIFHNASKIYADLKKRGQLIEDADILIATTALVHDSIVVSNNTRHFKRVKGLVVENWI